MPYNKNNALASKNTGYTEQQTVMPWYVSLYHVAETFRTTLDITTSINLVIQATIIIEIAAGICARAGVIDLHIPSETLSTIATATVVAGEMAGGVEVMTAAVVAAVVVGGATAIEEIIVNAMTEIGITITNLLVEYSIA